MRTLKRAIYLSLLAVVAPIVCSQSASAQSPAPAVPATAKPAPDSKMAPIKELRLANNTTCLITVLPKGKPSSPAPAPALPPAAAGSPAPAGKPSKATAAPAQKPAVTGYQIAKEEKILHLVKTRTDGVNEYWVMPGMQLVKGRGGTVFISVLPGDDKGLDLNETDFPGLHWAIGLTPMLVKDPDGRNLLMVEIEADKAPPTKAMLQQVEEYKQMMGEQASPEEIAKMLHHANAAGTLRLALDPATRLPVRSEDATSVSTYTFSPSSGLAASMPPDVAAKYKKWAAVITKASRQSVP